MQDKENNVGIDGLTNLILIFLSIQYEIYRDPWSKEEELKLFQEVQRKGKRWAEISLNIFSLKRTENNIKNRYYNIIK